MSQGRILNASSVVLVRERSGHRELFWVRRSREVSLGGGFYAFPGGRIDDSDRELAREWGLSETDGGLRIAALRELFEETGVLLTQQSIPQESLDVARKGLLSGELTFKSALERLGLPRVDVDALHEAGRWLTPPYLKVRFDTRFFVAHAPVSQTPSVWPGELVDGEWIAPEDAIAKWEQARALLHPPALHILRTLQKSGIPECLPPLCSPPYLVDYVAERIEFQAGVHLVPVRTPTIPPATHTNCYIVGEEELVVIDPASPYEDEQERLATFCEGLIAEGRRFREILLTHHHHDHVGGVESLRKRLGIPVRAHAETAELLRGDIAVDSLIEDGEVIALPGRLGLRLRAVFTPGHAPGHLCFFEENTSTLFTGDMVAGIGSIVVNPPDGDMLLYMDSLRRMRALPVGALYPAHGPTIPDGPRKIDEYIAHRQERENQIEAALRKVGAASPEELVPHVYTDVPEAMYPLAARSLIAVLEKLQKEGRATLGDENRYQLTA